MIDFVNTTGKNKGKVQNTKLAAYLNMSEGGIRAIKKKSEKQFNINYLGSFCHANNISIEDLREHIEIKEKRLYQLMSILDPQKNRKN